MNTDAVKNDHEVREDFVAKDVYLDQSYVAIERERLWAKTWQMACREEELATPGAYVTYDIAGMSVAIVRVAQDRIKAYHNACPHRGNQLMKGCGRANKIFCGFHGWQWDLDGSNIFIKDAEDWAICGGLTPAEVRLRDVRVGQWGGFVFINPDEDCEPFEEFIAPVPATMDCVEFDRMRIVWHKTMPVEANWKVVIESFMESYHVAATHFQTLDFLDAVTVSTERGKHGSHTNRQGRPFGAPAAQTGRPVPENFPAAFGAAVQEVARQTGGVGTSSRRAAGLVGEVVAELDPETPPAEVYALFGRRLREAAIAEGAGWPDVTPEQAAGLGVDWSIFPNMVLVFGLDSSLVFRARPLGDDPGRALFDMWGIYRVVPGETPVYAHEYYENWRDHGDDIPAILLQDLRNMEHVHRGMQSPGFRGSRLNPVQERQIYNLHRVLREYLGMPAAAVQSAD